MVTNTLIPVTHLVCGKTAFWITRRPKFGEKIEAMSIRREDGSTPVAATVLCAGCGALVPGGFQCQPEGGYAL
jgi:hypothetical protein